MPSYTNKMAIVSWPSILWRHFTLCINWTKLKWPEQFDPVTRRVHWSLASSSRLYFILIGCCENRTVSARLVLNTCIPVRLLSANSSVTACVSSVFSSVHVLRTSLWVRVGVSYGGRCPRWSILGHLTMRSMRGLSVWSLLVATMSPANTDGPIEMLYVMCMDWGGPKKSCIH